MFLSILITCLLHIMLVLLGEILFWPITRVSRRVKGKEPQSVFLDGVYLNG